MPAADLHSLPSRDARSDVVVDHKQNQTAPGSTRVSTHQPRVSTQEHSCEYCSAERRGTTALSDTQDETRREHARTPSPMRTRPHVHAPACARTCLGERRDVEHMPSAVGRCRSCPGLGDGATPGDALTGGMDGMPGPAAAASRRSSPAGTQLATAQSMPQAPERMWPSPGAGHSGPVPLFQRRVGGRLRPHERDRLRAKALLDLTQRRCRCNRSRSVACAAARCNRLGCTLSGGAPLQPDGLQRVRCTMYAACCLVHVAWCMLRGACCKLHWCMLHGECCMPRVPCCILHVACRVLHVVCRILHAANCILHAAS